MKDLFGNMPNDSSKTYRAIRHDVVRQRQYNNDGLAHHPKHKSIQIDKCLEGKSGLKILELFSGRGNTTRILEKYGEVDAYDKTYLKTGDSYLVYHKLISEKKKYDVIDLDPYGFPSRFFPDIFLLIDNGIMFITMPKPSVNILNGITQTHLMVYFGDKNPSKETIIKKIAVFGLCHWRQIECINYVDLKSVWRFAFHVKKVKATEYTGVRNR